MGERKTTQERAVLALDIAKDVYPLLAGRDPAVQGAILIDLVSTKQQNG